MDDEAERVWGPDLFAWAYDLLAASEGWRGQPAPENVEHEPAVIRWRDKIRCGGGWIPEDVLGEARATIDEIDDQYTGLLQLVVAIDRAYVGIRLNRPCMASPLAALAARWEECGSLERTARGRVLRKGSHWRAGSALAHYCADLARVAPTVDHRIGVCQQLSVASLGNLVRDQGATAEVSIAFVPALDGQDAMAFVPVNNGDARLFRVALEPAVQETLFVAADELVRSLEDAGANIAVLPETVIEPRVREALRRALIENNARCIDAGRLPALRLLVAGVGEPGRNEVAVLGSDGRTLFTQPKTQQWRLDGPQLGRYGLDEVLGGDDRVEDIAVGSAVTFLDDPGLGRLAVLICEDLARADPAWLLTVAATTSVVLSPVCDGSLANGRWAWVAAQRLADEPGALTLVANSFVLPDRESRAEGSGVVRQAGIAVVFHPEDRGQTTVVEGAPGAHGFYTRTVTWEQAWG